MDVTEKYYQSLLRMKAHVEMQLAVINEGIAAIETERLPPVPRKRRNLKQERMDELHENMLKGKVLKPSWLKFKKPTKRKKL